MHSFPTRIVLLALLAASLQFFDVLFAAAPPDNTSLLFIGTYTGAKSRGIYTSRFNSANGRLSPPELAAETRNPSFLVVHPNRRWLYAVGEVDDFAGQHAGAVSAFHIDQETGRLTLLNAQPSGGSAPCHISLDPSGKCLLVANYSSGSIAAFPVGVDGQVGPKGASIQHRGSSVNPQRQEGPHAHFILPAPSGHRALTCDLGLDKVFVYHLDADQASLMPNEPPSVSLKPGSGPRHLAFHPDGRHVYVINEMGSSLTAFEYQAKTGGLKELQTVSTLPPDFKGENTCAEVQVAASGHFVYASNRGHNSIAAFAVDPRRGTLTSLACEPSGGKTPRHFLLDPTGRWLLAENQDSNNLVVFRVDPSQGRLTRTEEKIEVGSPVCAAFLP
jgi:6-phosphogluconolactonase